MNIRKKIAGLTALTVLLSGLFVYGSPTLPTVSASLSSEKNSLESQKKKINQELAEINKQLASTKNNIAKEQQYQQNLDQQISLNLQKMNLLDQQMTQLGEEIAETEEKLTELESKIEEKQGEVDQTAADYRLRMRASYMTHTFSPLEYLFRAESFSDLLTNMQMIQAISRHDTQLLEDLKLQQTGLKNEQVQAERIKEDLNEQKTDAETSRNDMKVTNQQLQAAYEQSKTATQDLEQEQKNFEANKAKRQREAKEIDNEISAIMKKIAEQNAQNAQNGGNIVTEAGFLWPLPGFPHINSHYGWRFNHTDFHTGTDIGGAGVHGSNIVAAKSGVVAAPMKHWSYGNNVVINHGDGYVTLYAHCSQVLVRPGQTVKQGQVIAKVGATGNVTGPHLHFEVFYKGVRQNPENLIRY